MKRLHIHQITNRLLRDIPIRRPDLKTQIHDYYRLQKYPPGHLTYTGYQACGISCQLLQEYLPKYTFQTNKVHLYDPEFGYHNDHIYLTWKNYIIDPTWRQFFTCSNHKLLFEVFDPIFVGTSKSLKKQISLFDEQCKNLPQKTDLF